MLFSLGQVKWRLKFFHVPFKTLFFAETQQHCHPAREGKVSNIDPSGQPCCSLFQFPRSHREYGQFPLMDASPSQITNLQFAEHPKSSFISIYTLKWREPQQEQSVLPNIKT